MNTVKAVMFELARQLPDDCTWDDVMKRIHVLQKLDAGLRDADAGKTVSHEEVFGEFAHRDDLSG